MRITSGYRKESNSTQNCKSIEDEINDYIRVISYENFDTFDF